MKTSESTRFVLDDRLPMPREASANRSCSTDLCKAYLDTLSMALLQGATYPECDPKGQTKPYSRNLLGLQKCARGIGRVPSSLDLQETEPRIAALVAVDCHYHLLPLVLSTSLVRCRLLVGSTLLLLGMKADCSKEIGLRPLLLGYRALSQFLSSASRCLTLLQKPRKSAT